METFLKAYERTTRIQVSYEVVVIRCLPNTIDGVNMCDRVHPPSSIFLRKEKDEINQIPSMVLLQPSMGL